MGELFSVAKNNITYHLQNIFKSGELDKDSVTQKIRVTASDGKNYNTNFYSLDAIIAVGKKMKKIFLKKLNGILKNLNITNS